MIIGLTGAKRSGKNTVAKFIRDNFFGDYTVYEHSFAAKLKQSAVAALIGTVVSEEDAIEACDMLKENSEIVIKMPLDIGSNVAPMTTWQKLSGRQYLQWYGTEAHRRIFGEDFWTDIVLNEIYDRKDGTVWEENLDVITDVRFPDEAKAIKYMGGKIVKVTRPGLEQNDAHVSEQGIPDELIDFEIWNDGSLDQLKYKTIDATREVIRRS